MKQLNYTPELNIDILETDEHCNTFEKQAIICRFNCVWPKPVELFHWIFTNWTTHYEIHLYSRGFFIVNFPSTEARDVILREGPWFWGSMGLFITPWFLEFDVNTMVVSMMSIWVHLHNLSLHLWNRQVLASIGNTIGHYIKTDTQRLEEIIFTFSWICVEVDLSKGLPYQIQLKHKQRCWTQILD